MLLRRRMRFAILRRFLECGWLVNGHAGWVRAAEYLVNHIGRLTEQSRETRSVGSVSTVVVHGFAELVHRLHPQIMCCLDEIMHIRADKGVTANKKNIHTLLLEWSERCFNCLATLKVSRSQLA